MLSSCPLCHVDIPFLELEWHVNNHLAEDELAKDEELAQQFALAPPSPRFMDEPMNYAESTDSSMKNPECSTSSFNYISSDCIEIIDQEKISSLVSLQIKSPLYKIEGGLMVLLRRCLESEKGNSQSVISGYVDHYQSMKSEDMGFGCGWRNIQMLSSHLLMQRQEARDVIFGGLGFVPDIPSLQRWLEIAWERGFDQIGSKSFNHQVYGSRKWIGTTECATLFRSFGLRARIVDFDLLSYSIRKRATELNNGRRGGKGIVKHVYGPMDKFLYREKHDNVEVGPFSCENSQQGHNGKISGHQVLVDWIWNYFKCKVSGGLGDSQRVLISEKTPLYFQHQGHSRTIVGIQMQKGMHGAQDRYSLLVLDPGQRTADLESSLRGGNGWQKLIKRGVHTLRKPQYQLCYIDPGIAHGEEIQKLKTLESILVEC